jgi:branched-chain amino acid transport system substrate-binding protein
MNKQTARRLFVVTLSAILLLMLVTGCAKKEAEILIGAPIPMTGPYASDGEQMKMALDMAIEETNAEGGLLGRPVRLVVADVGGLEAEKINAAGERLIGEGVNAVITGYDDGGVDTHVFGPYDVPYLHCNAMTLSTQPVAENPDYWNVFQYCANEVAYGIDASTRLFEIPEEMGWTPHNKKVAIIKVDYAYNIMAADEFRDRIAPQGYEVVVDEVTQFGVVEWGPILSKIEETEPSYITFWNLDPSDAARFMIQLREHFGEAGFNALVFMQYTPAIPEFLELAGESAEGLIWVTDVAPWGEGVEEYTQRWIDEYGEEPKGVYAYATRDGFDIWAEAVEQAGCVDCYEEIADNIRNIHHEGLCANYEFTDDDQSAVVGDDLAPVVWNQIWDGESRITWPANQKVWDYQLPPWIPQ